MVFTSLDIGLFVIYFILLFIAIFWMIILFTSDDFNKRKKLTSFPHFSTIVPAYNEEKSIKETLISLVNLDYPSDKKEIVVVNDGSSDNTQKIVENFIRDHPRENIILINQENAGKGNALNNGLKHINGDFFACLDADSFIHSNALQKMLPYFAADKNVAAVCPLLKVKKPKSILQKVQWCEYIVNMFYKSLNARIDCVHVTPGPFSVYHTEVIKKLGGFDENTITEDLEIAIRLQKYHYKIIQTFDTMVETVAPNSWKTLFKQRVRWYKGSVDNSLRYKELMFNKKYGDFGFLRMPTIILSGMIAISLFVLLTKESFLRVYHWFFSLKAVNFDIITLVKNVQFELNFLSLPFFKLVIAGTLLMISFFVMIQSYKLVKEDIRNHGKTWLSLITYLLIYSFFIAFVWVYIAFMFVTKRKNSWS
jgi:poly-beta-1,6-N-acetyl-D-glucosamine synthase